MSRAFVKEDAAGGDLLIPPRAPLPAGTVNYVTPRGKALLLDEQETLRRALASVPAGGADDTERRRKRAVLTGRLEALNARIAAARVINPSEQPAGQVRFGATVTVAARQKRQEDRIMTLTIVGVDEADPAAGLIPFTAPIAKVLTGRRAGETAVLKTARGEETLEVLEIRYGS